MSMQVTHHDAQDTYAPYSASYGLMGLADGANLAPNKASPGLSVRVPPSSKHAPPKWHACMQ